MGHGPRLGTTILTRAGDQDDVSSQANSLKLSYYPIVQAESKARIIRMIILDTRMIRMIILDSRMIILVVYLRWQFEGIS